MQTNLPLGEYVRDVEYIKTKNNNSINVQRERVKEILLGHPEGVTDREISIITGISRSSVNARRNELKDIIAVGIAVYTDEYGNNHLNTLWGKKNILG